jgi:GPH family glycoside/pentoside/hexuronide:cation symporter
MSTKIVFGAPNFAGSAIGIALGIHLNIFYSDVVLVPLGYIALVIALARSFDAITDPLMGWITDRTNTRWGRRRPWMFVGAPLQAAALILLFSPPEGYSTQTLTFWFGACYIVYFLFHTVIFIPHAGLGPELTNDYHERSSLFAWAEGFMLLGIIYASGVPRLVTQRIWGERLGFSVFAIVTAVLLVALYWLLVARIRERPDYYKRAPNPLVPGIRRTMRNGPFRILLASNLIGGLTGAISGLLMPYFVIYLIRPENPLMWVPWLLMLIFVSAFVALPLWVALARRFGKKEVFIASRILAIVTFLSFFLVGDGDLLLYAVLVAFAGVANGGYTFLYPAIQADVIDYDELLTGKRREAQYASLMTILTKFTTIPSAAIPLGILASLGYMPNVEQNETVKFALSALYSLAPAAGAFVSLAVFLLYPINARRHEAIIEAVATHQRGESAIDPLTGQTVPPPSDRGVEEVTGWFLDNFSPRELRGLLARGARSVSRSALAATAVSLVLLLVAVRAALAELGDMTAPPGGAAVFLIVGAGAALTALCYHAIRLRAARKMHAQPVPTSVVRAHLEDLEVVRRA